MKTRDSMHRKARMNGSVNDWQAFRDLKKKIKSILRKAEIEYINEQICANKNNTRGNLENYSESTTYEIELHHTLHQGSPGILANEFFICSTLNLSPVPKSERF